MYQIELIIFCLMLGIILRLSNRLPESAPKVLGGWVINVALPATALRKVHEVTIEPSWILAAATPWLGVFLALAVLIPIANYLQWSRQRLGALLLVAGWGNTSFVGLPMIAAYYNSNWLGLGLFIDLFGSYLALSVLGIAIATFCSHDQFDVRLIVRRILTFPPFIAIIIALSTNHLDRPDSINVLLDTLSSTLTPLALAAVGFAIRFDRLQGRLTAIITGLGFRLLLAPLAITILYLALGKAHNPVAQIAIFEMSMPPMLGASIIAMEYDLEPDLVALLIGIGIPLSLLTAPLWRLVLSTI